MTANPPISPRTRFAVRAVRTIRRVESWSCSAKCSETNLVAARLTPTSRKARYPITTQAKENKPNCVSPKNDMSFGMATSKTRKIHPSVARFSDAFRASNDDGVSRGDCVGTESTTSGNFAVLEMIHLKWRNRSQRGLNICDIDIHG